MKNFLQILLISSLFIGCSSNDDDEITPEDTMPILVTKEIYTESNGEQDVITYRYDQDKIIDITDSNTKFVYTYNGNDIVKEVEYHGTKVSQINEYFYNNGKLISQNVTDNNLSHQYSYTINYNYITDNNVQYTTVTGYLYNASTNVYTYSYQENDAYLSNGNVYKIITKAANSGTTTYNYTYDDKNNPYKNIKGFITSHMFRANNSKIASINNLTKRTYSQSVLNLVYTGATNNTLTYGNNSYPSKVVTVESGSNFATYSYTRIFEYNK